jgi:hypothetical protein
MPISPRQNKLRLADATYFDVTNLSEMAQRAQELLKEADKQLFPACPHPVTHKLICSTFAP